MSSSAGTSASAAAANPEEGRIIRPCQVLPGVQRSSQRCSSWVQHEGRSFVAYGCGSALVIVSGIVKVVQFIQTESRVNGVHFSHKDAKLVCSYGHKASVFVPTHGLHEDEPQWRHSFDIDERFQITAVRWLEPSTPGSASGQQQQQFITPSGPTPAGEESVVSTLVVAGTSLCVYEWSDAPIARPSTPSATPPPLAPPQPPPPPPEAAFAPVLKMKRDLGRPVSAVSCSPDARFVATIGTTDCLVKVWYKRPNPPLCLAVNGSKLVCAEADEEEVARGSISRAVDSFSFMYLRHPATVLHISWRPSREGPHAPNVLMTTSVDGIVRLWAEQFDLDSMPTPVPQYTTPRLHLCGTVPAGLGSLVEWVRTLQPAETPQQQPVQAPPSPSKKRRKGDDDDDKKEETEEQTAQRQEEQARDPRNFFHTGGACPILARFSPASKKVGMAGSDWISEFDRFGNVIIWKFKSVPLQMPTVSIWAKTSLYGPANSAANTKAIIPISFSFSDFSSRLIPTSFWLYVINSAGLINWWTLTRTSNTVPAALNAELHAQIWGHRNPISQVVSHPTLPWTASISSEQNIILWRLDDTKPFEHPYLLRDVCAIGQYTVLAWVPSGNLFMVTVGNAIFVYALDEPQQESVGAGVPSATAAAIPVTSSSAATATATAMGGDHPSPSSSPPPPMMPYFMMGMLEQSEALDDVTFLDAVPGSVMPHPAVEGEDEPSDPDWVAIAVADGGRRAVLWECSVDESAFVSRCFLAKTFVDADGDRVTCACVMQSSPVRDSVSAGSFRAVLLTGHADGTARMWSLSLAEGGDGSRSYELQEAVRVKAHLGPVSCVRAAYFGRFASWEAPSGDVKIWQLEAGRDPSFQLEASFPYPAGTTTTTNARFDFLTLGDGSDVFALAAGNRAIVYAQKSDLSDSHRLLTRWYEVAVSPSLSPSCSALSWTFNGTLIIAAGPQIHAFSRFAMTAKRHHREEVPSEPGMKPSLFRVALSSHHAAPTFHPRILEEYIRSSELHKVETVLQRLLPYLSELDDPACRPSAVFQLNMADFLAAKPWAPAGAPSAQSSASAPAAAEDLGAPRIGFDDEAISPSSAPHAAASQWLDTEDGKRLTDLVKKVQVPELDEQEHARLRAIVDVIHDLRSVETALDAAGIRYYSAFKLFSAYKKAGIDCEMRSSDFLWALLSDAHDALLKLCFPGDVDWETARAAGVGFWLCNQTALRDLMERIAKVTFARDKNPADCAAFYLALGKRSALLSLYKYVKDQKVTRFLMNDFSNPKWLAAAAKNAFVLEGQRKYLYATAFFLLANQLEDAVQVCLSKLKDQQLALILARLVEPAVAAEGKTLPGPLAQRLLRESILQPAKEAGDQCLCSIVHWMLRDFQPALESLAAGAVPTVGVAFDTSTYYLHGHVAGHVMLRNAPAALRRTSPLLKRLVYEFGHAGCAAVFVDMLRLLPAARAREYADEDEEELEKIAESQRKAASEKAASSKEKEPAAATPSEEFDEFGGRISRPKIEAEVDEFGGSTKTTGWFDEESPAPAASAPPLPSPAIPEEQKVATAAMRAKSERIEKATLDTLRFCCCLNQVSTHIVTSDTDTSALGGVISAWAGATGVDHEALVQAAIEFSEIYGYFSHEAVAARLSPRPHDALKAMLEVVSGAVQHVCSLPAHLVASYLSDALARNLEAVARQLYPSIQEVKSLASPLLRRRAEFSVFFGLFCAWWKRRDWSAIRDLLSFDVDTVLPFSAKTARPPPGAAPAISVTAADEESEAAPAASALPPTAEDLLAEEATNDFAEALLGIVAVRVALIRLESFFSRSLPDAPWQPGASPATSFADTVRTLDQWASLLEQRLGLCIPSADILRAPQGKLAKTLMTLVKQKSTVVKQNKPWWDFVRMHFKSAYKLSKSHIFGRLQKTVPEEGIRDLSFEDTKARSTEQGGIITFGVLSGDTRYVAVANKGGIREVDLNPKQGREGEQEGPAEEPSTEHKRSSSTMPYGARVLSPYLADEDEAARSPSPPHRAGSPDLPQPGKTIPIVAPEGTRPQVPKKEPNPIARQKGVDVKGPSATPPPRFFNPRLCQRSVATYYIDPHPLFPYYLSGGSDGKVYLWQLMVQKELSTFAISVPAGAPITRVRFSPTGMRFGAVDKAGNFALWNSISGENSVLPFYRVAAHSKGASDFAFLNAGTFIATCGATAGQPPRKNVCLWDTLLPASSTMVAQYVDIENPVTCVAYSPRYQLLVAGDSQGAIHALDIRKFAVMQTIKEHGSEVTALSFEPHNEFFFSTSADGTSKAWRAQPLSLEHTWSAAAPEKRLSRSVSSVVFREMSANGVNDLQVVEKDGKLSVFTAGHDGKLLENIVQYAI